MCTAIRRSLTRPRRSRRASGRWPCCLLRLARLPARSRARGSAPARRAGRRACGCVRSSRRDTVYGACGANAVATSGSSRHWSCTSPARSKYSSRRARPRGREIDDRQADARAEAVACGTSRPARRGRNSSRCSRWCRRAASRRSPASTPSATNSGPITAPSIGQMWPCSQSISGRSSATPRSSVIGLCACALTRPGISTRVRARHGFARRRSARAHRRSAAPRRSRRRAPRRRGPPAPRRAVRPAPPGRLRSAGRRLRRRPTRVPRRGRT